MARREAWYLRLYSAFGLVRDAKDLLVFAISGGLVTTGLSYATRTSAWLAQQALIVQSSVWLSMFLFAAWALANVRLVLFPVSPGPRLAQFHQDGVDKILCK